MCFHFSSLLLFVSTHREDLVMARSRAAPARSSSASHSHAPPPAARPAATHQQQSHAPPPPHGAAQQPHGQPAQPQVTNIYVQKSGGGMMGGGGGGMGFMGTMASVAAGSVVGHGLSNMIFGKDHPPAEPAQAQAVAQQYGDGACGPQIKGYAKCMEVNAQNTQQCTWAWDLFMQCQDKNGGQQQA